MLRNLILNDQLKVPQMAFHTMNLCEDYIVIYGGIGKNEKILGDLIFIKQNRDKFLIASYENNKNNFPRPRHSHSAVYLGTKQKRLYIFGGITPEGYSDELWSLEISSKPAFNLLKSTGVSSRCRVASFSCRGRFYIYGGFGIDRISKKYQILNDLYVFDIESGSEYTKEVMTKGGIDMNNYFFKVVRLSEEYPDDPKWDHRNPVQFAFFCADLSQFFIFDVDTDTFTKIAPKFFVHQPRENFIVERLSDGRIVLFGGMSEKENMCFNEAFVLVGFQYMQKDKGEDSNRLGNNSNLHYSWNDVDLYGVVNEVTGSEEVPVECGYNGHASVKLSNDHILIFGGTMECYFPIFNRSKSNRNIKFNSKNEMISDTNTNSNNTMTNNNSLSNNNIADDPIFTRRLKILDMFNTYQWEKPIKSNADKSHIYPRILHVSQIIPKESKDDHTLLFTHGGEYEQKMLCHYSLFDMDAEVWLDPPESMKGKDFCPQLKSHASSYIFDPDRKEFYVILTGGMYKEHLSNCEASTNKQKERCGCTTELVSNKIYAYRNHKFTPINVIWKDNIDLTDKIKRFGHNMVTAPDGCVYMLCGYAQYIGYLVDLIKFKPKADVKNKAFYFEAEAVDIVKTMPGRIHSTAQIVQNNVIVFGGIKDEHTLNDLWVLNLVNLTAYGVNVLSNWIYPRFGMSSVLNLHASNYGMADPNSVRLIIFGGSYWNGKELVYGMTNEIVVFNLKFADESYTECDVFQSLPSVYGKGSKRIFHQSVYYKDRMYVFGGHNHLLLKLKMPECRYLDYKKSLDDYYKEFPLIHYTSLLHNQEDERDNKFESSSRLERTNKSSSQDKIKSKTKGESVTLLEETSTTSKKVDNSVNLNNTSNIINQSSIELMRMEDKDKADRSMISAVEDMSIDSGKKNLIKDEMSNISSNQAKKGKFTIKKKGWDADYK